MIEYNFIPIRTNLINQILLENGINPENASFIEYEIVDKAVRKFPNDMNLIREAVEAHFEVRYQ